MVRVWGKGRGPGSEQGEFQGGLVWPAARIIPSWRDFRACPASVF